MIEIGHNLQHAIEFGIAFTSLLLGLKMILKFGFDLLVKMNEDE